MSITSMLVRAVFRRGDEKRDAGLTTPADIVRYDDVVYGPDRRRNVLDVYRPKGAGGKLPVIVSVHGGAWVYGDKERYQYYCMSLAQHGFAVVNFTYRLAPKFKYPSQLEDTNSVFAWVLDNAERFGFDTEHVFGVGDSAGAHLLSLFCCLCTNPDYAAQYPFRAPAGFAPTAVALNCGVYEIRIGAKKDMAARLMADLLPDKGTEEELRRISPIHHVTAQFTGDGILTSLKLMEVMLAKEKPMSELAAPVVFYPQVLKNVRVKSKPEAQNDPDVQAAVQAVAEALGDTGRILVRESGTEPVIRVMVEAESDELCEKYVDQVIEVIKAKGHIA